MSNRKFVRTKLKRIAQGKEKHPVMMTQEERHEATAKVVREMKFSEGTLRYMAAATRAMKGMLGKLTGGEAEP
jgi:hypothetical protein